MTARKDVGASVRARLLQVARARGDDFQLLLVRYANERLLHRLARSRHRERFVVKGATLFTLWTGHPHRATRDVDLLGVGNPSADAIRGVFTELLGDMIDDGVWFDIASLTIEPIREDQKYGGVRVELLARIAAARIRLQIDVGFGDAVTPAPELIDFPVLLDFPAPRLLVYPRETVVAEKLEAVAQLGIANTRMKDFYDLFVLAREFAFDGEPLVRAIRATFGRRGTPFAEQLPVGLSPTFATDARKATQWAAFAREAAARDAADLPATVAAIAGFAERPLSAAARDEPLAARWPPGGPWR